MACYDVLVSCEAVTSGQQNPLLSFETSLGCCVGCPVSSGILCLVSSLSCRLEETYWNVCTSPNSSSGTFLKGPESCVGTVFISSIKIGQYLISTSCPRDICHPQVPRGGREEDGGRSDVFISSIGFSRNLQGFMPGISRLGNPGQPGKVFQL